IPDEPGLAVHATFEAPYSTVPLFVGVSMVEQAREPELYPTVDTGLLQCGGVRRQYRVASDDSDDSFDWLQIAQFQKTPGGLVADSEFIPECMFLNTHASLWGAQQQIQSLASQALDVLEKRSSSAIPVFAAAAALAGSLGPAARMIDPNLHPHSYMD